MLLSDTSRNVQRQEDTILNFNLGSRGVERILKTLILKIKNYFFPNNTSQGKYPKI